jgi:hypothetical protein
VGRDGAVFGRRNQNAIKRVVGQARRLPGGRIASPFAKAEREDKGDFNSVLAAAEQCRCLKPARIFLNPNCASRHLIWTVYGNRQRRPAVGSHVQSVVG